MNGARRTALVTGASAGIGEAIARELARRGFDVALTARRRDKLDMVAAGIRDATGAATHVVAADLADPAAPDAIAAALAADGVAIDVLVNNAGYGVSESFLESTWESQERFLRVMLTSVQHLTHVFVPAMRERGWGRVLNVASVAAYAPPRPGTLYGPVKRFLVEATRGMAFELEGSGVTATALCPGFTYSEFHDAMGTRAQVSKLPKWMWQSAADVAREGVDAMLKGRVVHVTGRANRLMVAGGRVAPVSLVRAVSQALGVQRKKKEQ